MVACHPAFRGTSALEDPWGNSNYAEQEIGAYLSAHPELFAQAAKHATSVAVSSVVSPNPFRAAVEAKPDTGTAPYSSSSSSSTANREDANPFK
jgi:hypothetical protein